MNQTRRTFIATAAAVAASPALPTFAAPLFERWPPDLLELERVANMICSHNHSTNLLQAVYDLGAEQTEIYQRMARNEERARRELRDLTPEHEPARAALARYLTDGTTPLSPRPVPPFMADACPPPRTIGTG